MNWWRHVVAMELRKILAYRSDFWVTFIGQVLMTLVIARALWGAIFEATNNEVMEGFTLPMMTLYFLIVPIGNKMLMGENVGFLSREIYDGSFTRYLIYPISFFQYKTITYLTHSAFYGLQLIIVFLVYCLFQNTLGGDVLLNLLIGVGLYFLASFVYAMLSIFVELFSLWADNIWSLMVMVRFTVYFMGGTFIPLNFYPDWFQEFVTYTPFPYLISLPVRTIMGLSSVSDIYQGIFFLILWGLFFMMSAALLWKTGQKKYTGVGI